MACCLAGFVTQQVHWVRGTQEPADQVEAGTMAVALGTDGMLTPTAGVRTRFVLPKRDGEALPASTNS